MGKLRLSKVIIISQFCKSIKWYKWGWNCIWYWDSRCHFYMLKKTKGENVDSSPLNCTTAPSMPRSQYHKVPLCTVLLVARLLLAELLVSKALMLLQKISLLVIPVDPSCNQITRKEKKRDKCGQWVFCGPILSFDSFPIGEWFSAKVFWKFLSVPQLRRNHFSWGSSEVGVKGFFLSEGFKPWKGLFILPLVDSDQALDRLERVCQGTGSFPLGQEKLHRVPVPMQKEGTAILPGKESVSGPSARLVSLHWDAAVHCVRQAAEGCRYVPLLLLPQV